MLRQQVNSWWIRAWAAACLALCGVTACSAVWANRRPNPVDTALRMLEELEAETPNDPALAALRARLERHR